MHKIKYFSLIFVLLFSTNASAGLSDKWNRFREKNIDPVGDKIEREVKRARNDVINQGKRVEAEIRRNRDKIKKIVKEIEDKVKKLRKLEKVARTAVKDLEKVGKEIGAKTEETIGRVSEAKDFIEKIKEPETLIKFATADILQKEFQKVIQDGTLNKFLETDLIKHVRVIDLLNPIYGVAEKLDITGITKCTRQNVTLSVGQNPEKATSIESLAFTARSEAISCFGKFVSKDERPAGSGNQNDALTKQLKDAKKYSQQQNKDLQLSEEELAIQAEYQKNMAAKKNKIEKDLDTLASLEKRLRKNSQDNRGQTTFFC